MPTSSPKNQKGLKSTSRSESQPSAGCHPPDSPDDGSEAGTYTIDEDVEVDKSDVTKARLDIDRLFGLEQTETSDQGDGCLTSDVKHSLGENEVDIGKMSLEELMKQVSVKVMMMKDSIIGVINQVGIKGVMKHVGIKGVMKQVGIKGVMKHVGIKGAMKQVNIKGVMKHVGIKGMVKQVGIKGVINQVGIKGVMKLVGIDTCGFLTG